MLNFRLLITALALAGTLGGASIAHAAALADTPTPTETPTITPTPTETFTPSPTSTALATETPSPPWQIVITLPPPPFWLGPGTSVLIERRWTYGDMAVFYGVLALCALVSLRWIYDVVRQEMVRRAP